MIDRADYYRFEVVVSGKTLINDVWSLVQQDKYSIDQINIEKAKGELLKVIGDLFDKYMTNYKQTDEMVPDER
jgi:hypothetical protein